MNRVAKTEQLTQAEFSNVFAQAEEFDPNDLPEHFALIIVAARRMGKTHYLKHLLHQLHMGKRQFDAVFIFSETAALQPDNFY
jgi:predicted AAA+ superfamily ATPase